jgi:hypothetical protein
MANHPPSTAEIEAFAQRIIAVSKLLNACADATVVSAQKARDAGQMGFADFNTVLQKKLTVTQKCFEIAENASSVLLKIAASELAPLHAATEELQAASDNLHEVSRSVQVISELAVAAAAVAVAITTPNPASIGAAGAAIVKVTKEIREDD